jgi:hypothetical protein
MNLWTGGLAAIVLAAMTSGAFAQRTAAPASKPLDIWAPSDQKVTIYTKDKPPATPKLEDLPLKESVSQYGITWTFDKPARVGQFINGDWYVVGPVTVVKLDPKPLYGAEVPESEVDQSGTFEGMNVDWTGKPANRVRNGFMLNPPALSKVSYDNAVRNYFDPALIQKLPAAMKPTDSLVATISMPRGLVIKAQLWQGIARASGDGSPIRTAAVLTCVAAPQPSDAFRPAYCDRAAKMYFSRDLKREMLPKVSLTKSMPDPRLYVRFTERPWVATCFFGFEEPVENMPQYGREFGRVAGTDALLLCADLTPEQKEPLLVDYVQVGIDLVGMIRAGHPGWEGFGGHGSGRKLPIVFAGLLLGDEELANVNKSFPKAHFGEDEQTAYGDCWTGAKVVFTGHRAIDEVTGIARQATGPYEHKQPKDWTGARGGGDQMSEAYRHTASFSWIAQALAIRLLKAEKAWNHDAFLDYCDRWMYEDDAPFNKVQKEATGKDHSASWERQGGVFDDAFIVDMWKAHRAGPGMPPTDGWQKQHDDSYYKNAIEKMNQMGAAAPK